MRAGRGGGRCRRRTRARESERVGPSPPSPHDNPPAAPFPPGHLPPSSFLQARKRDAKWWEGAVTDHVESTGVSAVTARAGRILRGLADQATDLASPGKRRHPRQVPTSPVQRHAPSPPHRNRPGRVHGGEEDETEEEEGTGAGSQGSPRSVGTQEMLDEDSDGDDGAARNAQAGGAATERDPEQAGPSEGGDVGAAASKALSAVGGLFSSFMPGGSKDAAAATADPSQNPEPRPAEKGGTLSWLGL